MYVPAKYAMLLRRVLLWPLTLLHGGVLSLRHALYDTGLLKRTRPSIPTIAIGNLALGGTGKTPMLELVLRTLEGTTPIATLSRGYGRKGADIHEVGVADNAQRSGDEPVQVKRKFPAVRVFVGADRVAAISTIQREIPGVKVVVLDDALQHLRLDADLNILLTTWQRPYCDDALVPAGRLRDLRSRAKAAQAVVVTKCPGPPSLQDQVEWRRRLGLEPGQELFFTGIEYTEPAPCITTNWVEQRGDTPAFRAIDTNCLLITGIADPAPLLEHTKGLFAHVDHAAFPDHHPFSAGDLLALAKRSAKFAPGPKMLVTTEKDAVRLLPLLTDGPLVGAPLVVIGMRTVVLNGPERFEELIRRHVATHPAHR